MRLEYTEDQEKELRITEIESILTNNLYENEIEELALEVELQFLRGNVDGYGTPIAFIGNDDVTFDMGYSGRIQRAICALLDRGIDTLFIHSDNSLSYKMERLGQFEICTYYESRWASISTIRNVEILQDFIKFISLY